MKIPLLTLLLSHMLISCQCPSSDDSCSDEATAGEATAGEATEMACSGEREWLTVPIRFHLLSSEIDLLNSSFSNADVERTLAESAVFWEQACVRFEIESIIADPVLDEQAQRFNERVMAGPMSGEYREIMSQVMPDQNMLSPGWNVMIFKQFPAPASGIYITEIKSVLWSEELPPQAPMRDNPPLILAHEMGHSFGLVHYEGPNPANNMMNAEVMQTRETAHSLTEEQINKARQQIERGMPFEGP